MEKWDINCTKCGKFILTEQQEEFVGNVKCVAGSYDDGYYHGKKDVFYCKECAKELGLDI